MAKWFGLFGLLTVLMLGGCNTAIAPSSTPSPPRVVKDWLTDSHAALRRRQVDGVHYQLSFDLTSSERYHATNTIELTVKLLSDDLTLDFSGGEIQSLKVNGVATDIRYNGFFITIDKQALQMGSNTIEVRYSHPYSDNGSGLYRYVDPGDNNTYLYTHFEPYEGNKLFPVFDQPNLRARYTVAVTAPADWQVFTSVGETRVTEQGGSKLWQFPTSKPFSTYIFPLHAGPYQMWQSQYRDVPLRLFSRRSTAQWVKPERWFDVTRKGMAFFEDYFDFPYPFGKYDQLIVPDFNISGMENVAAVTYTERVLSRGLETRQRSEVIAGLLLHELSHMWFGDLVTVDWWSNLWLKESFATYMSNLALGDTGLSDNVWPYFYRRYQIGGISS